MPDAYLTAMFACQTNALTLYVSASQAQPAGQDHAAFTLETARTIRQNMQDQKALVARLCGGAAPYLSDRVLSAPIAYLIWGEALGHRFYLYNLRPYGPEQINVAGEFSAWPPNVNMTGIYAFTFPGAPDDSCVWKLDKLKQNRELETLDGCRFNTLVKINEWGPFDYATRLPCPLQIRPVPGSDAKIQIVSATPGTLYYGTPLSVPLLMPPNAGSWPGQASLDTFNLEPVGIHLGRKFSTPIGDRPNETLIGFTHAMRKEFDALLRAEIDATEFIRRSIYDMVLGDSLAQLFPWPGHS